MRSPLGDGPTNSQGFAHVFRVSRSIAAQGRRDGRIGRESVEEWVGIVRIRVFGSNSGRFGPIWVGLKNGLERPRGVEIYQPIKTGLSRLIRPI